tara:strand:- start:1083 stop:2447 length:1365 start_codon:yes stop_codon:yes gene_type:complete
MSFESLVKKLMKEGKSKTAATKIAGSVANAKMKGAGSGPTAKQKARAKSPATKKKPIAVRRDKDRVPDKSRSYTDKKGKKIEIKTFKAQKKYDSGVKDDPNKPSMRRKSSRLANTVELHKTKTKKDGTTKTKVKRAAGGGKKSQRLHTKFAKGKNKEGSSDVTITRKSPTTMKKQGYNARLDDSLGAKNGKKKQSMKSRRDESEGMEKKMGKKKFSGNKSSAQGKAPAKMKSPAKKPLMGKQKSLPKELQEAILKSPGKMLSKSGIKMMDKSPAKSLKINPIEEGSTSTKERVKLGRRKNKTVETKKSKSPDGPNVTTKTKTVLDKKTGNTKQIQKKKVGNKTVKKLKTNSPMGPKTPMKKSKQKVEQDYARNAIADYKSGKTKEAKYEKKKALEVAAGESMAKMKKSPSMMKNPMMMKSNQDGGAYAAKNMAAPARQLKKLGSVLSKHFKSNR